MDRAALRHASEQSPHRRNFPSNEASVRLGDRDDDTSAAAFIREEAVNRAPYIRGAQQEIDGESHDEPKCEEGRVAGVRAVILSNWRNETRARRFVPEQGRARRPGRSSSPCELGVEQPMVFAGNPVVALLTLRHRALRLRPIRVSV
jgi:hypothetical protein